MSGDWFAATPGREAAEAIAYRLRRVIDLVRERRVAEAERVLLEGLAEVAGSAVIPAGAREHLRVRLEIGLAALREGGVEEGIRALRLASLLTGRAA